MTRNLLKISMLLILILLISAGCSKDSTEPDHTHADAEGLTLTLNGVEVVRIEEGAITGGISVSAGTETALISLQFLDHDGDEFVPDDEDYSLGYSFANGDIAEWEQHSEDGKYRFHVVGKAAGSTTLTLELLHGDHADYQSPPIPITVTQ